MPELWKTVVLGLETRDKTPIRVELTRMPSLAGDKLECEAYKTQYKPPVVHRPAGPCRTYNCHGLTFGGRRGWIHSAEQVEQILKEDNYIEVRLADVLPGDVAIYRKAGVIEHSGIVVEKVTMVPKILSKWAKLHEAIHPLFDCPYADMQVSYYRVCD